MNFQEKNDESIGVDTLESPDEQAQSTIPPQYQGLSSEVVEEIWQNPIYIDDEKNNSEIKRRETALQEIKEQELARESQKAQEYTEKFKSLSEEQRNKFPALQQKAVSSIADYIKGASNIEAKLSDEEKFILSKVKALWQESQEKDPSAPLTLEFSRGIDKQIYSNLLNKLAFDELQIDEIKAEQQKIVNVREKLGIHLNPPEIVQEHKIEKKEDTPTSENGRALKMIEDLLEKRISKLDPTRKALIEQGIRSLLQIRATENNKKDIAGLLMDELYSAKRTAKYEQNPGYFEAWEYANQNKDVYAKQENGWIYRGLMASKSEKSKTETRGSLNINVTTEAVKELDNLIKKGVIKGNYKFGDPQQGSAAADRHDAITIYFLENPSQEAISALSDIAQKHFRGNNLLGKKVTEGFYISDVGSVSDKHAEELIDKLTVSDQELGSALKTRLTKVDHAKKTSRVAMSEGQYYAIKETLNAYGYDIPYDSKNGFTLIKLEKDN